MDMTKIIPLGAQLARTAQYGSAASPRIARLVEHCIVGLNEQNAKRKWAVQLELRCSANRRNDFLP